MNKVKLVVSNSDRNDILTALKLWHKTVNAQSKDGLTMLIDQIDSAGLYHQEEEERHNNADDLANKFDMPMCNHRFTRLEQGQEIWNVNTLKKYKVFELYTNFIGEYKEGEKRKKGIQGYYAIRLEGDCSDVKCISCVTYSKRRWADSYEDAVKERYSDINTAKASFEMAYDDILFST